MNLDQLRDLCLDYLGDVMASDPAHDITHVKRVVQNTLMLTDAESGNAAVSIPAAWLHDCVSVPKDSPLRKQASQLAAQEAVRFLESINYPSGLLPQMPSKHTASRPISRRNLLKPVSSRTLTGSKRWARLVLRGVS